MTGAVVGKVDSGVSVAAAQYFVSGLRAFLLFCFLEMLVAADLVAGGAFGQRPMALVAADGDQPR